ncbi:MAG: hypothetical protein WDW38_008096 [Sanguina aurantia]
MRVKKHKHTRKAVQFYKINYGFHDPYKVLLDGNFVHATRESNLADLQTHIPRLLGAKCKMYTTACVMKELRSMGKDFGPTTRAAGNYEIHKCGHTKGESKPAAECIMEQIGAKNNNHWFIATQDMPLRYKLAKIPGCPCVFATVNGLHLEAPPEKARVEVKQSEVRAQLVPAHELASAALEGLEELRPRDRSKSIFRRNFAKGPNPLSMKKKISKPAPTRAKQAEQPVASAGQEKGESGPKKKRVRKKTADAPSAAE